MPGPRNTKAKKKIALKKEKARSAAAMKNASSPNSSFLTDSSHNDTSSSSGGPSDMEVNQSFDTDPVIISPSHPPLEMDPHPHDLSKEIEPPPLPQPCIHDPGNGPRIKDLNAFFDSRFSSPPSWDEPECMDFYYQHVLEFLERLLPYEQAVILWYNKTRVKARICPACRRFYRLGDRLYRDPLEPRLGEKGEELLSREQEQSGLCSFMCFGVAGYNYPGAIGAWGLLDDELDDATREWLNGPGLGVDDDGFGMYLKLTRQADPGFRNIIRLCHEPDPFNSEPL